MFSAIQAHFASHCDLPDEEAREPALGLIDDALKMPFTVFTTSHKKTFLKWHAKLTGQGDGSATATSSGQAAEKQRPYQVYDVSDATISCMTAEGDTVELDPAASEAALMAQVRELFDSGEDVSVYLDAARKTLTGIAR